MVAAKTLRQEDDRTVRFSRVLDVLTHEQSVRTESRTDGLILEPGELFRTSSVRILPDLLRSKEHREVITDAHEVQELPLGRQRNTSIDDAVVRAAEVVDEVIMRTSDRSIDVTTCVPFDIRIVDRAVRASLEEERGVAVHVNDVRSRVSGLLSLIVRSENVRREVRSVVRSAAGQDVGHVTNLIHRVYCITVKTFLTEHVLDEGLRRCDTLTIDRFREELRIESSERFTRCELLLDDLLTDDVEVRREPGHGDRKLTRARVVCRNEVGDVERKLSRLVDNVRADSTVDNLLTVRIDDSLRNRVPLDELNRSEAVRDSAVRLNTRESVLSLVVVEAETVAATPLTRRRRNDRQRRIPRVAIRRARLIVTALIRSGTKRDTPREFETRDRGLRLHINTSDELVTCEVQLTVVADERNRGRRLLVVVGLTLSELFKLTDGSVLTTDFGRQHEVLATSNRSRSRLSHHRLRRGRTGDIAIRGDSVTRLRNVEQRILELRRQISLAGVVNADLRKFLTFADENRLVTRVDRERIVLVGSEWRTILDGLPSIFGRLDVEMTLGTVCFGNLVGTKLDREIGIASSLPQDHVLACRGALERRVNVLAVLAVVILLADNNRLIARLIVREDDVVIEDAALFTLSIDRDLGTELVQVEQTSDAVTLPLRDVGLFVADLNISTGIDRGLFTAAHQECAVHRESLHQEVGVLTPVLTELVERIGAKYQTCIRKRRTPHRLTDWSLLTPDEIERLVKRHHFHLKDGSDAVIPDMHLYMGIWLYCAHIDFLTCFLGSNDTIVVFQTTDFRTFFWIEK